MPVSITMNASPQPFSMIFCLKMFLKADINFWPRCSHGILFGSISFVCKMDEVKDPLLHLMKGDNAHSFRMIRLHQLVKFKHENFIESCAITIG